MALQLSLVPGAEGSLPALTAMTVGGGPMNARGSRERRATGSGHAVPPRLRDVRVPGPHHVASRRRRRRHPARRATADPSPAPRSGSSTRRPRAGGRGVGNAQVRGPSLFVGYARDGAHDRQSSRWTGSWPTGTSSRQRRRHHQHPAAARSRSSSAVAATSTSTRSRRRWRASPGSLRCASSRCPDDLLGERAAALVVVVGADLSLDEVREAPGRGRGPEVQVAGVRLRSSRTCPQNRVGQARPSRGDAATQRSRPMRAPGPESGRLTRLAHLT